jgi:hypothetical protein
LSGFRPASRQHRESHGAAVRVAMVPRVRSRHRRGRRPRRLAEDADARAIASVSPLMDAWTNIDAL